jgi:hypothetical protein
MKILALSALLAVSTTVSATDVVSVTIGAGGPNVDACPSVAELNTLTVVYKGPDSGFAEVIRLKPGTQLHVCGHTKDGRWTSVVLAQEGVLDCKVSSPVARPKFYRGPCTSGWLPTKNVRIIAG